MSNAVIEADDEFTDLPGILAEIAEAAGREAAELIAEHRGGSRVYFPPSEALRNDHWLPALVGAVRAVKIAKAIADPLGINLEVPLGPAGQTRRAYRSRMAAVRSMTLEGASTTLIARHLGITDRGVRQIRARLRQTGQLPTKAAIAAQRIASARPSGELIRNSEKEEKIKNLLRSGLSSSQIVERLHVDHSYIRLIKEKLKYREGTK